MGLNPSGLPLKGAPTQEGPNSKEPLLNGVILKGGPTQGGPHSRGLAPDALKPFCLGEPLSESAFARGPSFFGAPIFVGALCSCTSCICLNPALFHDLEMLLNTIM
jgi:hypothetical protein